MNKLMGALICVGLSVGLMTIGVGSYKEVQQAQETTSDNNVGNGQEYAYEITEINGDEINGVPLNKASDGNRGIFLLADEVDFEVKVGDKIAVVWGEYEDEFKSIERY